MRFALLPALILLSSLFVTSFAWADASPEQVLDAHFKAIRAEDINGAEQYFSRAFRDAFGDSQRLAEYYLVRDEQLEQPYTVLESGPLQDAGDLRTAVVVVEFGDPREDSPVQITERMYYYFIREEAGGNNFSIGPDGTAWRIDIFDALRYPTLADARRRPYLYTKQAWPDSEGKDLKSRQGLFRLQWALSAYRDDNGGFPATLPGGKDGADPLLSGQYIRDFYPLSGFDDKPMQHVALNQQSSGDYSYFPVDVEGDGVYEDFFLLQHGATASDYYYLDHDIVYILSSREGTQELLAELFAAWWKQQGNAELTTTTAVEEQPVAGLVSPALQPAVLSAYGRNAEPVNPRRVWASSSALLASYSIDDGAGKLRPVGEAETAMPIVPGLKLRVYSFGW